MNGTGTSHPPPFTSTCETQAEPLVISPNPPPPPKKGFDHKENKENPQPHARHLHLPPAASGRPSAPWARQLCSLSLLLYHQPSRLFGLDGSRIDAAEPSEIGLLPRLQIERRGPSDLRDERGPLGGKGVGGRPTSAWLSGTQCKKKKKCDTRKDVRPHEDRVTFPKTGFGAVRLRNRHQSPTGLPHERRPTVTLLF